MDEVLKKAKQRNNLKYYNKLIQENAVRKQPLVAEKLYSQMISHRITPTIYTISALLNAYLRGHMKHKIDNVIAELRVHNIQPNVVTYTTLIKGYGDFLDIKSAYRTFKRMEGEGIQPTTRTYNALLRACLKTGSYDLAKTIYGLMAIEDKDRSTYLIMMTIYGCIADLDSALSIYVHMKKDNLAFSSKALTVLASACTLMGSLAQAGEVLKESGIEEDFEVHSIKTILKSSNEMPFTKSYGEGMFNSGFIFEELSTPIKETGKPLKLEICSGSGDWLVKRAMREPTTEWIGLEVRPDRVHDIWRKCLLNDVSNIRVICSDANKVDQFIYHNTAAEVFINFPDPPKSYESKQRFVNKDFLQSIHSILKRFGILTILTDDELYCNWICDDLLDLKDLYTTYKGSMVVDEIPDYGSSFFDDITLSKGRRKRYFIRVKSI